MAANPDADMRDRLESIDLKLRDHDERFERIDRRFDEHDRRFDRIDQRLDDHDRRFDEHDRRFDRIDQRLDALSIKIDVATEHLADLLKMAVEAMQTGLERFDREMTAMRREFHGRWQDHDRILGDHERRIRALE